MEDDNEVEQSPRRSFEEVNAKRSVGELAHNEWRAVKKRGKDRNTEPSWERILVVLL